jgi:hypothetical protein
MLSVSAMGCKHKSQDGGVARVTRAPRPVIHDRVVSVHTTAGGRTLLTTKSLTTTVISGSTNQDFHTHGLSSTEEEPGNVEIDNSFTLGDDAGWATLEQEGNIGESEPAQYQNDSPLHEWASIHRATYLDELIRHDGHGEEHVCHGNCGDEGIYKCQDCFGGHLWCCNCFVHQHAFLPFH